MDRPAFDRQRRFLHRLAQAGMRMACAGNVLRAGAEFHGGGDFGDQRAGVRADDVGAENAVVVLSARIFTKPSVSPMARARPLAVKGNLPTL